MDILELENPHGVIVSTGGQIPNNLAMRLDEQHVNILGTSAKSIDNAEDREKFSAMLDRIGVDQPRWKELSSMEDINGFVAEARIGSPELRAEWRRHECLLESRGVGAFLEIGRQRQPKASGGGKSVHRACERGGDGCRGRSWRDRDVCH